MAKVDRLHKTLTNSRRDRLGIVFAVRKKKGNLHKILTFLVVVQFESSSFSYVRVVWNE